MGALTLIDTITVGSGGAASLDFTSIPATYTDLILKVSARCSTTGYYSGYQQAMYARFNSSSTNYSHKWLQGEGSGSINSGTNSYFTAGTSYAPIGTIDPSDWTANTFSNVETYFSNYSSSQNKSYSSEGVAESNGFGSQIYFTGLWSSTAAINAISLTLASGNFVQYSTAYLYGVKSS